MMQPSQLTNRLKEKIELLAYMKLYRLLENYQLLLFPEVRFFLCYDYPEMFLTFAGHRQMSARNCTLKSLRGKELACSLRVCFTSSITRFFASS